MKLTAAQKLVIDQLETAELNGSTAITFDCGRFKTSYTTVKSLVKKGLISIIKHGLKNGSVNWVEITLTKEDVTYFLSGKSVSRGEFQRTWFLKLRRFGYLNLTGEDVSRQIDNILSNKKLSVIGHFMADGIIIYRNDK